MDDFPCQRILEAMHVQRRSADGVCLEIAIPADLPSLEGHFPDNPVLPAVAILELSLLLARRFELLPSAPLRRVRQAKFLELIRPDMRVRIEIKATTSDSVDVEWMVGGTGEANWKRSAAFDLSLS